jgi:hypothetical protein
MISTTKQAKFKQCLLPIRNLVLQESTTIPVPITAEENIWVFKTKQQEAGRNYTASFTICALRQTYEQATFKWWLIGKDIKGSGHTLFFRYLHHMTVQPGTPLKVKLKCRCGADSIAAVEADCALTPQLVPSFISRGAARHTARDPPANERRKHY